MIKTFLINKAIVPVLIQSFLKKTISISLAMHILAQIMRIFTDKDIISLIATFLFSYKLPAALS